MATRFELILPLEASGLAEVALRAAAEEALAEIPEAEDRLSVYRPHSEIARVNAGAATGPVRVTPVVFELLSRACTAAQETGGAFDPTVGAVVRLWRELDPADPEWTNRMARAREATGWGHVELDPAASTVRLRRPGLQLDLGSVGKGWAMDRAVQRLREAGVASALLHGGTSTVVALGAPPGAEGWPVGVASGTGSAGGLERRLRDASLSVSATWGRTHVDAHGRRHGHVVDPRTGQPVAGPARAVVEGPDGWSTDVLSTALLVAGPAFLPRLSDFGPDVRGWRD